ncbi:MAG: NAD-dependent epimerase/dehydratase family protein [Alphaproteobacteria bacterium]|nr:MAG: NAD-dependent epimerase/dehydratase family protein [Alphaproteobacteria bacterium]
MAILVTGAAGFIGSYVCKALLERGEEVIGVDNLNDYYPVALKQARLGLLEPHTNFTFHQVDIADVAALKQSVSGRKVTRVVHLAAQAGVRYSLENPMAYAQSNLVGHLAVLELCRHTEGFEHLVYASSSSVYGNANQAPFAEEAEVDRPVSLYAATKRSGELISYSYASLYGLPQTGLRFFTVYGPWGRPDMAYWSFTDAIIQGRPIKVFNNGDMRRDFSYIDDIVAGIMASLDTPPVAGADGLPNRVFNIGNSRPEELMHFISVIEDAVGRKAELELLPMQAGDVYETSADTHLIEETCGFSSHTPIEVGIPKFVDWFRSYNHES